MQIKIEFFMFHTIRSTKRYFHISLVAQTASGAVCSRRTKRYVLFAVFLPASCFTRPLWFVFEPLPVFGSIANCVCSDSAHLFDKSNRDRTVIEGAKTIGMERQAEDDGALIVPQWPNSQSVTRKKDNHLMKN
jgi:hypothetical protein